MAEEGISWESLMEEIDWEDSEGHDEPPVDSSGAVERLEEMDDMVVCWHWAS